MMRISQASRGREPPEENITDIAFRRWLTPPARRWLLCAAIGLTLAGCGSGPKNRVTGQITLDGKPLAGAQVQFVPKSDLTLGYASATTDETGAFKIEPDARNNNLLRPGTFVILVNKEVAQNPGGEMGTPMLSVVPKIYSSQAQTPLSAEIKEGDNSLPVMELHSEKKK